MKRIAVVALLSAAVVLGYAVLDMTMTRRMLAVAGGSGIFLPQFDDEFNAANEEWDVWTGVPGNTADFNSTVAGKAYLESGMIVTRSRIPTPPFTMTAYVSSVLYDDINTTYANVTLGVGPTPADENGGAFYGLEWDVDTLGRIGIYDGLFNPMFGDIPTHFGTITDNQLGLVNQIPHWQRMVVNSASDIDLWYSKNGTDYTLYIEGVNPGLTLQAVYLVSFGATTNWDWVRFTRP